MSEIATCVVMKQPVSKEEAEGKGLVREVDGQKYHFCCSACGPMFDANPQKYIQDDTEVVPVCH